MAQQSFVNIDMVTYESLSVLENQLVVTRNVDRQYDSQFGNAGWKIGNTLRVRLPQRFTVTEGAALQIQEQQETVKDLLIANQWHVDMGFTSVDFALSVDDFNERFIFPAMSQLASRIDNEMAKIIYLGSWQSVGTPGTTPNSYDVMLDAQQLLNEQAVSDAYRYLTLNPAGQKGILLGCKGLFNPQGLLESQFKKGILYERQAGYDEVTYSQSVYTHLTGSRNSTGATVSTTVSTEGSSVIAMTGLGSNATLKQGDVFSVTNVYTVNPQTRRTTGTIAQMVVAEDTVADGSGNANVPILPGLYSASQVLANVTQLPQSGAAVIFWGAPSSNYAQNLVYTKKGVAFVTAPLPLPEGVQLAKRAEHNGISIRIVSQYLIGNDMTPSRCDVVWGGGVLRGQEVVRVWG